MRHYEVNYIGRDFKKKMGIIKEYRLGFLLYALVFVGGLTLVIAIPKPELHLLMNSNHTPFQDAFFKAITWLGDGWFAVIFSLIFLLVRFRYFFMLILSFSLSGLLTQFLKRVVFPGALRPAAWLEQNRNSSRCRTLSNTQLSLRAYHLSLCCPSACRIYPEKQVSRFPGYGTGLVRGIFTGLSLPAFSC